MKNLNCKIFEIYFFGILCVLAINAPRANSTEQIDREWIKRFSGCFNVTFDFTETLGHQKNYKFYPPYHESGLEWVSVDEDRPGHISLQHLLIAPGGSMKHWRQVWDFEASSVFEFQGRNRWTKRDLPPDERTGRWVQRVYQVDDSPRYECSAPWVHWGSNHYWECSAWAPLPRREFSQRSDYNVLARRNRQQVIDTGWRHEEDNLKLNVSESGLWQEPIASEKGTDLYLRTDADRCESTRLWWESHQPHWAEIQKVWDEVYASSRELRLQAKIDGKPLWQQLFEIEDAVSSQPTWDAADFRAQARALIDSYRN